jgi:hypothetical protein
MKFVKGKNFYKKNDWGGLTENRKLVYITPSSFCRLWLPWEVAPNFLLLLPQAVFFYPGNTPHDFDAAMQKECKSR